MTVAKAIRNTLDGGLEEAAVEVWEVSNVASGDRAEAESLDAVLVAARALARDHVRAGGDPRSARLGSTVTLNGVYHGAATRLARAGFSS